MEKSFTDKMGYKSPFEDSFNESSENNPKPIVKTSDSAVLARINQEKQEAKEQQEKQQQEGGEVKESKSGTNIVVVNKEGTRINQVNHEMVGVGESISQVKRVTSAGYTKQGTVFVSQFRTQVASRGEEVWAYKNDHATFEGTLEQAKKAFPDVDFSGLDPAKGLVISQEVDPSIEIPPNSPLLWHPLNEFDAVKDNKGKPTDWKSYLDATQTAIDMIGMIPIAGDAADIINCTISLARGNYADAALSFASAIPVAGVFVGSAKILKKIAKTAEDEKGVYDLVVKNADDLEGYVGQSQNVVNRIKDHFKKTLNGGGKLSHTVLKETPIIHKMPGSDPLEREIYEQYIILEKYGGNLKKEGEAGYLLNKVNPVGGRFDLKTKAGEKLFKDRALKIAKKYKLPTTFDPLIF
ncbi:hypothetical protein [Flavobacterium sp.]|jgi:hypothetical protein|uniref:hypothetical protein n=1 Tax=Flavobacterium sp. TaxID=239 RepID=UPI0037BFCBA9